MSGPLFFPTGTTNGTPAEAPATAPKGTPVDARGEAFDFAALLSAGVTAAADEGRSAFDGAAQSVGQAAPSAPGALPAPQGRGTRREARDRGSPQVAAAPVAMVVLAPVALSPGWLPVGRPAIGPAPRQDTAPSHAGAPASAATPALVVAPPPSNGIAVPAAVGPAVTTPARELASPATSVPATAPATTTETSTAPAVAMATVRARSTAGAPLVASQNAAESAAPPGPPAPGRSTTTTTAAHATGRPVATRAPTTTPVRAATTVAGATTSAVPGVTTSAVPGATRSAVPGATTIAVPGATPVRAATAVPGAPAAGIATLTETGTGTTPATASNARLAPVAPADGSVASRTPALASPRVASAAIPHARVPFAGQASPAVGSKAPSAGTPVGAGDREAPSPVLLAADSAVAPPVVTSPPAAAALSADADVAVADQPMVAVAPLPTTAAASVDVVALAQPIEIDPTAHEPATKADAVSLEPPPAAATTRSQGRVVMADAAPAKNPGVSALTSVGQPVAPAAAHVAVPGRPARADHAPAGVDGAPAAPAAVRSKIGDGTAALPDRASPAPNAQPAAALEVAPVDAAGPAKSVTVVTKATPAATVPSAAVGARLRDALVSVANHAVLRGDATGQIDVPELGRIAVRAHSTGATVDVAVTAEGQDARATLRGHLSAMTADLHAADVPVGRLTIDGASAAFGDSLGSSMSSPDRGSGTGGDSPRDNRRQSDGDMPPAVVEAVLPRRVRIVL